MMFLETTAISPGAPAVRFFPANIEFGQKPDSLGTFQTQQFALFLPGHMAKQLQDLLVWGLWVLK